MRVPAECLAPLLDDEDPDVSALAQQRWREERVDTDEH
jgi:hypothetical protein